MLESLSLSLKIRLSEQRLLGRRQDPSSPAKPHRHLQSSQPPGIHAQVRCHIPVGAANRMETRRLQPDSSVCSCQVADMLYSSMDIEEYGGQCNGLANPELC